MSDSTVTPADFSSATREQIMSALFAHLIMQQSNMALMLLGKTPHPETGETIRDPETAKMFIDLLEMLELKTKGNLTKEEGTLLKNALLATRMAFVESVNSPAPAADAKPVTAEATASSPAPAPAAPGAEEDSKKKFTKKY